MSLTIFSREKGFLDKKFAIIIIISSLNYIPPRGSTKRQSKTKRCLSKTEKNIVKIWTKMSIKVTFFKQTYPKFLKAGRMRRQKSH